MPGFFHTLRSIAYPLSLTSGVTGTLPVANGGTGGTAGVYSAWAAWSPTATGWTDVGGAPTITGRYCQVRNAVYAQAKIVPVVTTASTAGTSYLSLPVAAGASGLGGDGSMADLTTLISIGEVVIDYANSRCYVPTWGASGDSLVLGFWYEV